MKIASPAFGLISGISASLGLLPHIAALGFFLMVGLPQHSVTFLIVLTIGAKVLGEWFFLDFCKKRMDSEPKLKNWRLVINKSLLSHPNVVVGLLMVLLDIFTDLTLLNAALKTSISPIWIFLALLGCQSLASPIQGALSDIFSQKRSLLFASIIAMIVDFTVTEIPLEGGTVIISPYSLLNLLKISSFSTDMQIFIILCGKGLLANLAVISRAAIAEVIKMQTITKDAQLKKHIA